MRAAGIHIRQLGNELQRGIKKAEYTIGQGEDRQLGHRIGVFGQGRILKLHRQHHAHPDEGEGPVKSPIGEHLSLGAV
jgi:hypothetical protein